MPVARQLGLESEYAYLRPSIKRFPQGECVTHTHTHTRAHTHMHADTQLGRKEQQCASVWCSRNVRDYDVCVCVCVCVCVWCSRYVGAEQERLALQAGFSRAKHYPVGFGFMGILVATK